MTKADLAFAFLAGAAVHAIVQWIADAAFRRRVSEAALRAKDCGNMSTAEEDADSAFRGVGRFSDEPWADSVSVADWSVFRSGSRDLTEYIIEYYKNIEDFPVRARVEPGYLQKSLPSAALPVSERGESWRAIMRDVEAFVLPGMTHWQSPSFFAYYPANTSPPALMGEMLSACFNAIGFSWEASPAATELETVAMDQLAALVGLPAAFSSGGTGGGVIQGTASEAVLVAMLAARARAARTLRSAAAGAVAAAAPKPVRASAGTAEGETVGAAAAGLAGGKAAAAAGAGMSDADVAALPDSELSQLHARMTVYTSDQAHSCVKKAAMICGLEHGLRVIPASAATNYALDPERLSAALAADVAAGRVPVFACVSVGTTSTCGIDPVAAIAQVLRRYEHCWLHVDAAYAGAAAICPEYREVLLDGVGEADSFCFNPHKWLLVNFDCSALWVQDRRPLVQALSVTPEFLRSAEYDSGRVSDYRDWQVPLGRKFRALKIWFTLRAYGAARLRGHIRKHCALAAHFADLVRADQRWELVAPPRLGLVCFRLRGNGGGCGDGRDGPTRLVKERLAAGGKAFLVNTVLEGRYVLRFAVGSPRTEERHVVETWRELQRLADEALREQSEEIASGRNPP